MPIMRLYPARQSFDQYLRARALWPLWPHFPLFIIAGHCDCFVPSTAITVGDGARKEPAPTARPFSTTAGGRKTVPHFISTSARSCPTGMTVTLPILTIWMVPSAINS